MVQWYNGTMVQWYNGTMVQWYNGIMATKLYDEWNFRPSNHYTTIPFDLFVLASYYKK